MAFHESVWVVAGTAAPVIALAAVVSLADSGGTFLGVPVPVPRREATGPGRANARFVEFLKRGFRAARWVAGVGLLNLLLQAALLAVSHVSLADEVNLVPPWLAVAAAVGGLLLLAVTSLGAVHVRLLRRAAMGLWGDL